MTKQRKLVLDIIRASTKHMTAQEIYIAAKDVMPSIAIGTIYRNLNILVDRGEIRRITIPNSPDRFDKSMHYHEHLVCKNCGKLEDVVFPSIKDYIEKETGVEILGYDLSLRHICDVCKAEVKQ